MNTSVPACCACSTGSTTRAGDREPREAAAAERLHRVTGVPTPVARQLATTVRGRGSSGRAAHARLLGGDDLRGQRRRAPQGCAGGLQFVGDLGGDEFGVQGADVGSTSSARCRVSSDSRLSSRRAAMSARRRSRVGGAGVDGDGTARVMAALRDEAGRWRSSAPHRLVPRPYDDCRFHDPQPVNTDNSSRDVERMPLGPSRPARPAGRPSRTGSRSRAATSAGPADAGQVTRRSCSTGRRPGRRAVPAGGGVGTRCCRR